MRWSSRSAASSATSLARNSLKTEASKPVSASSRPSAYFQSIRPQTASGSWCSTLERPSLTEFLTEDDRPTGGVQHTRRTGSTSFWDVSSTSGPQGNGRTITGGRRIWSALVDDQEEQARAPNGQ